MKTELKNYHPTYALSDYKIGDAYTFFVSDYNLDNFTIADEVITKKYSSTIDEIIKDNDYISKDNKWFSFTRVIGIVVDKYESSGDEDIDKLTVMIKTDDGRYVLKKYAANLKIKNAIINDKDSTLPPFCIVRHEREEQLNKIRKKRGRV